MYRLVQMMVSLVGMGIRENTTGLGHFGSQLFSNVSEIRNYRNCAVI